MQFLILILGLVMIIKSADLLIDSAVKIARRYGASSFIIGITVIAFGTSAPELAVGIVSGLNHTNQLTLGNIIGSSLSNIALIIGLSAVILPLQVKDTVVKRELPILVLIQLALGFMLFGDGQLSRIEGFILLGAFGLFMIYIARDAKRSMKIRIDTEGDMNTDNGLAMESTCDQKNPSVIRLWCYSLLSLLGLFIGGKLTVDSSTQIAQSFGLSETLIGLTVVALATTMPELITSITAVIKKEPDIVVGNCIGSNIFNILLVLGFSSVLSPIPTDSGLWFDVLTMLALTLLILTLSLFQKKLSRVTGVFLLTVYVVYLSLKVISVLAQ